MNRLGYRPSHRPYSPRGARVLKNIAHRDEVDRSGIAMCVAFLATLALAFALIWMWRA